MKEEPSLMRILGMILQEENKQKGVRK